MPNEHWRLSQETASFFFTSYISLVKQRSISRRNDCIEKRGVISLKKIMRQSALNYELFIILVVTIVPLIIWPVTNTTDYFYLPKVISLYVIIAAFYLILNLNRKALRSFVTLDSVTWLLLFYLLAISVSVSFALNTELALYGKPLREEGLFTMSIKPIMNIYISP